MAASLKNKTISGMIWSAIGKFGTLGLLFISNIVLARLLTPDDFGYIGMLYIFIAVSQTFINSGLGSALIQKKNITNIDYSTVFYWNLTLSILFIALLYFLAPLIADFYKMPFLKDILRVQSLGLLISSFSLVQTAQLQKSLRFKELSVRNIIATLVGVFVAVIFAFLGYGVWSLVFSSLLNSFVGVILLWKMSSWRPKFEFSWLSLRNLFSFGSMILFSSLVETLYTNIQGLIIGKAFSAKSLGYYTQARKLEEVPSSALSSIVNEVSFPVLSKMQDNIDGLKSSVKKSIQAVTFLNFPLMCLLFLIAKPLILILFSDKWATSIPFLQILSFGGMFYTINTVNTNLIRSLGKGKLYFINQTIKRIIALVLILFVVQYGIMSMLIVVSLSNLIFLVINAIFTGKLINYGLWMQIKDIFLTFVLSSGLSLLLYFMLSDISSNNYIILLLQSIIYVVGYILLSALFKIEGYSIYKEVILTYIKK